MEEKTIVKSQAGNAKKDLFMIWGVGIVLAIVLVYLIYHGGLGILGLWISPLVETLIWFSPFFVIGLVFYFATAKNELVVTDKRVYGRGMWGKRVDIPLDSVSSVGTTGWLKSVSVSSSSGTIAFALIPNREEIHSKITSLLIARQATPAAQESVKPATSQSDADELAKFKKLLDDGVITQEEFDAKKKKILDL